MKVLLEAGKECPSGGEDFLVDRIRPDTNANINSEKKINAGDIAEKRARESRFKSSLFQYVV